MSKPIMIGDLVDQVSRHMERHADTETLKAWAHLVEVFVATAKFLDGGDQPLGVCAWCRQPAANWDEAREHIKTCELRREWSERPVPYFEPKCGAHGNPEALCGECAEEDAELMSRHSFRHSPDGFECEDCGLIAHGDFDGYETCDGPNASNQKDPK